MGDAWAEADGAIRFDICTEGDPTFAMNGARDLLVGAFTPDIHGAQLQLVTLHADGRAELTSTGASAEFPMADPRRAGLARRYTAHVTKPGARRPMMQGLAVHDWTTGRYRTFDYGSRQVAEEAVFAPRPGSSEEFDGWLVAPSVNLAAQGTELHVFDARRVDEGPLCTWRAHLALPAGFHGRWRSA